MAAEVVIDQFEPVQVDFFALHESGSALSLSGAAS
jgi:hypothetical protein